MMASSSSSIGPGSSSAQPPQQDTRRNGQAKLDWNTNHGILRYGLRYLLQTKYAKQTDEARKKDEITQCFNAAFEDIIQACNFEEVPWGRLHSQWREHSRTARVNQGWEAVESADQSVEQQAAEAEAIRRVDQAAAQLGGEVQQPNNRNQDYPMTDYPLKDSTEAAQEEDEDEDDAVLDPYWWRDNTAGIVDWDAPTVKQHMNMLSKRNLYKLLKAMFPQVTTEHIKHVLRGALHDDQENMTAATATYDSLAGNWIPAFGLDDAFVHPDSPVRI